MHPGGFADALGRRVVSQARRQVGGAVAHPPNDAFVHQVGQSAVDGRVGLAKDERQLRRFDEGHPGEGVEQVLVGEGHKLSVAIERPCEQLARMFRRTVSSFTWR